jgi:serine O-acetyltransferase
VVIGAGAKILGPITLEDGVRIGSNAVVTKPVFANETVVGVPGRVLSDKSEHLSFDAYGVSNDNDPNIEAIKSILKRLDEIENKT